MAQKKQRDIIHRWEGNPIIAIEDLPFKSSDIWSAGAVKIDNTYILIVTIESLSGHKDLYIARGTDGFHFEIDETTFMLRSENETYGKYEEIGIMDARIIRLEGTYYISYIAESRHGFRIGLAKTDDFNSVERLGFVSEVDTKGGTLFPEKINNRYVRLERPKAGGRIWISYSDDLVYWGGSEVLISPRPGYWDSNRIGNAVPPMRVADGRWLMIYYGVRETSSGPLFRLGASFLSPNDPSKVIARTNIPILSPRENYERIGDINNLIFSCGAILEDSKLILYYGASRSCICIGTSTIEEIDRECFESEGAF